MEQAVPANELERRKQLRIRLRRDLAIEAQKYEGRTYHVVKDPVSLRYYRLKDNEHFLLQFLDGQHTLEEAQKAYEVRYRPERLKLEDLEGFAQQLLTAGLAQSESPRAGKQLYDRRKKRIRSEWMQVLTNILYIKLPVFDPDRLLQRMLRWLGWIFSVSFFAVSVAFMLAAALLVATHFEAFRSKLPDKEMFFRFQTIAYMWAALGAVKIIHEFGHGLSCKVFGGEVHEMGALFLCFSPALYCNVSDAWTLPNKWHRIIISAAGIYVELVIAAASTFIWWNTASHPFINNLALSLMVVCSVSTVVFNANPLMRYDGYYVLADWLEIPNLRERSNRFLKNLVLEHCLGVEVQPEAYMALWRRLLFVAYAITSYIYRWVVTFSILWFMYSFLRPYKLEVISQLLAFGAAASMAGWPLYRLGKNLHRRGRLPDMKRWRVMTSAAVLAALILFVCLVPVPVSRVRCSGIVQALPDTEASGKVFLRYGKEGGLSILDKLHARPGDTVKKGDLLAEFQDRDLEEKLKAAEVERDNQASHIALIEKQRREYEEKGQKEQARKLLGEQAELETKHQKAAAEVEMMIKIRDEELKLRAPCDGVIGQAPPIESIGKSFKADPNTPLFTINNPGRVRICLPVVTPEFNLLKEDLELLSDAAQHTRKLLRKKVSVSWKDARLADVLEDLKRQVKGLNTLRDPRGGVSEDLKVTYQGDRQRLDMVLDNIFAGLGLGYVLLSEPSGEHDGWLLIKAGRERGDPEGGRPLADLRVTIRITGRGAQTWQGKIHELPESEAKVVPLALSNKAGGPVAVKATPGPGGTLIPQTQHYFVYIDIVDPDEAIVPGTTAQVKVHCRPETCLHWLWRKINNTFDLGLM